MIDQREETRVIFLVTRKRSSYRLAERADMRGFSTSTERVSEIVGVTEEPKTPGRTYHDLDPEDYDVEEEISRLRETW